MLQDQLQTIRNTASALKSAASGFRTVSAAGNVSANAVIQLLRQCVTAREIFAAGIGDAALQDYARQMTGQPTLDLDARLGAINAELDSVVAFIAGNFPASADGYLLKDKLAADGSIDTRYFTPAQLASLRAVLDALVNAV
jgi:hypothetical protein